MVTRSLVVWGLFLAFSVGASDAAVLCQKKNKIFIRPEACKSKETPVQDLGALGTQATGVSDAVAALRGDVLAACAATNLTRAPAIRELVTDDNACGGGCRTHTGNEAACTAAYSVGANGATSCFYHHGVCLPCQGCGEAFGRCQNLCAPSPRTCADSARTVFAGAPFGDACDKFPSQETCEAAWHLGRDGTPATCYWDGSDCNGCGAKNELRGNCTNTCTAGGPPTCPGRATFITSRCTDIPDQTACEQAWHWDRNVQVPASCSWNGSRCFGCGIKHEGKDCTNVCN